MKVSRAVRAGVQSLVALVLVLAATTAAFAQGFYLKEIERDGRVYVFNIAANADRFEAGGDMGISITKPGAGPNGITVVGDSERALQLYFFKHGIAEAIPDPPPPAPAAPPFRITGLVFGDYVYYPEQHLPAWDKQQGFVFRRAYFTYDHTFSPTITTRLRLEMNGNGKLAGGALSPYVKDMYLRWTARGRQQLTLGMQPTLSFEFTETVWGLRHVEKTPLDLYRWDSSRDTGVTMAGPINLSGTVKYAAQFGNESGSNAETDKFKAYRLALRYETNPGFSIEGTVAQFNRDKDADRTTAQVFAAYRGRKARAGFQYSYQKRRAATGTVTPDQNLDVASGFVVWDQKLQKRSLFVRVDRFSDACADCSGIDYLPIETKGPFTLTMAGFEYYLHPSVRFTPNVEWVRYSTPEAAARPKDDLAARMTFYWTW